MLPNGPHANSIQHAHCSMPLTAPACSRAGNMPTRVQGQMTSATASNLTRMSTGAPTLSRTSQNALSRRSATPLARSSLNTGASGAAGAEKPTLARVSAQQYPNLSRASQHSTQSKMSHVASGGNLSRVSAVRAQQEVDRRAAASEASCSVTLSIQDSQAGKPAVYKVDGMRFAHSKHTVKFVQVRSSSTHRQVRSKALRQYQSVKLCLKRVTGSTACFAAGKVEDAMRCHKRRHAV